MGRIELIGAHVLAAKMLSLPDAIREAVERSAIKEANELVADQLKATIRQEASETGALEKSIRHDIRKTKDGNALIGRIGADSNYVGTVEQNKKGKKVFKKNKNAAGKNVRRPAKYYHLMNLGTQDRQTQAGHKRGKVNALNFREKTLERLAPIIERLFEKAANDALKQWDDGHLPF